MILHTLIEKVTITNKTFDTQKNGQKCFDKKLLRILDFIYEISFLNSKNSL